MVDPNTLMTLESVLVALSTGGITQQQALARLDYLKNPPARMAQKECEGQPGKHMLTVKAPFGWGWSYHADAILEVFSPENAAAVCEAARAAIASGKASSYKVARAQSKASKAKS